LVPDSAHGTNPASAALSGFHVVEVKSGPDGRISLADLESKLSPRVAALMLTNPNTLGLFEREILDVAEMVHAIGAMLYYDGANLNAFMGICRPGDMGFDAVHMNLHKTSPAARGGSPGRSGQQPIRPIRRLRPSSGRTATSSDFKRPKSMGGAQLLQQPDARAGHITSSRWVAAPPQASLDAVLGELPSRRSRASLICRTKAPACTSSSPAPTTWLGKGSRPMTYQGLLNGISTRPRSTSRWWCPRRSWSSPRGPRAATWTLRTAVKEIAKQAEEDPQTLHEAPHGLPVGRLDEVATARKINSYLQGQSEDPILRWKPAS
jgi:glycine dehydrogenase subunit 2